MRLPRGCTWVSWSLLLTALSASVLAQHASADTIALLQRLQLAARKLNYSGTIVSMQQGGQPQTSRITHVNEGGNERERLEMLDGTPLVVVRHNQQIMSYAPETRTVIIEKRAGRGGFPALLTEPATSVALHYEVRKGEIDRVAGMECQVLILEPRDRLRYSHRLWSDLGSGLLLKSQIVNEKGEVVEQIAFSQVEIGGSAERFGARLQKPSGGRNWRHVSPAVVDANFSDAGWRIENPFPGFRKVLELRRGIGETEVGQVVFSDGLASVSIFLEALRAGREVREGLASQGAINIFQRRIGDHLITVLGEAPPACVTRIAHAIEYKPGSRQ